MLKVETLAVFSCTTDEDNKLLPIVTEVSGGRLDYPTSESPRRDGGRSGGV